MSWRADARTERESARGRFRENIMRDKSVMRGVYIRCSFLFYTFKANFRVIFCVHGYLYIFLICYGSRLYYTFRVDNAAPHNEGC